MNIETEAGEFRSRLPDMKSDNGSNLWSFIDQSMNKPLPWFGILALIVIFMTAQSYQAKDQAEVAKQTAWKAETESMMLREHVDSLRMEMAAHGIIPSPLPKCLVENTPCRTRQ